MSSKDPALTIIVPVFNGELYLAKCISSILAQTFADFEVIVIDDGSTDASWSVLADFARKDSRIVPIRQENQGVSVARNKGLQSARGNYIGFVDCDDYVGPQMFELLVESLRHHRADIAECGVAIVDERGNTIIEQPLESAVTESREQCCRDFLLSRNTRNYCWNKVYSADLVREIRYPKLRFSEDYAFNVSAFLSCGKKVTVSGCHYFYLMHDASATRKPYGREKLDIILAGEAAHERARTDLPAMCHLTAAYIMDYCIFLYGFVRKQKDAVMRHDAEYLLSTYAKYYVLSHVPERAKDFGIRLEFSRATFRANPWFYYLLKRITSLVVQRF